MKYDHVIWDFNGTVLADMQAGIVAVNEMLSARGLPVLSDLEDYRRVFCFPVEEYYQKLGFDFEKEDFKGVLAPLWVSLYNKYSKDAPIFGGVQELTSALRAKGVRQSILSASEREMMHEQLRERCALDWFDEIWGNDSIHAYGKGALSVKWRESHPGAKAVMLGDTTHDFEVARAMGADCILIAAGHHSAQRLLACGVPVVADLFEAAALLGIAL
jgi:phosphoglycolate phosphatase